MSIVKRLLFEKFPTWDDPEECRFHRVTIDTDACDGCRMCVIACPARVLEVRRENGMRKAHVIEGSMGCISCNNCMAICRNEAIGATEHYRLTGFYETQGIGAMRPPRTSFSDE